MHSKLSSRVQLESLLGGHFSWPRTDRGTAGPEAILTGIRQLDETFGGIWRGALTEITGPVSSGRTSLLLSVLTSLTRKQEVCALVDANDMFDPESAAAAGVELERLLWVRCDGNPQQQRPTGRPHKSSAKARGMERLEQAFKAADFILQSKGFGMVVLDLAALPPELVHRVPLTSWFRFRRVVENTETALLVLEQEPHAKTCASLVLQLQPGQSKWDSSVPSVSPESPRPSHTFLLRGLGSEVNVLRWRGSHDQCRFNSHPRLCFEIHREWSGQPAQAAGRRMYVEEPFLSSAESAAVASRGFLEA